jgi:hypothetical protein
MTAVGRNFTVRINARPTAFRLEAASQRTSAQRLQMAQTSQSDLTLDYQFIQQKRRSGLPSTMTALGG